jgi:hypothetical protein
LANEIISYLEMCQREGLSLQKGMNYRANASYSIILMSQRPNAPYRDRVEGDGSDLIYEGHDVPRSLNTPDPKILDQTEFTPNGTLTENGKFYRAAKDFKLSKRNAEKVRVYEKIHAGIWSYNGLFNLVDSWIEYDGKRKVFKFKLCIITEDVNMPSVGTEFEHSRIIPSSVKLEVWKRDGGKCVICGATNELHFDHIIPYSKGGTSLRADNIQLLCARHNLGKSDNIE